VLLSPVDQTRIDYRALAQFRFELRRFQHFSESAAQAVGVEPQQHQLMLALKGLATRDEPPTIGNVAEWLQIRHHSAVELVDRAVARGLVRRQPDPTDRRQVLVELTAAGDALLRDLSALHRHELESRVPDLLKALRRVLNTNPQMGNAAR
jgi:DNA-binding MarR family transcriptional regulator